MKRGIYLMMFAICLFASVQIGQTFAADGVSDSPRSPEASSVTVAVDPSTTITGAKHVAKGVAMRLKTSGTIALRGVPLNSTVKKATLYWNFSDANASGPATNSIFFNGNTVVGNKVADNPDPCWSKTGNHTYAGDVTPFVPVKKPNEDYQVVLATTGSTSGQTPWSGELQARNNEGASLVVVYSNVNTATNNVYMYDALSNTMFSSGASTFTLNHPAPANSSGLFTMIGADGQLGSGYNYTVANETTTFNAVQIAGPTVGPSDWDGSDGWPLPQLWDTHTHNVSLQGASSVVVFTTGTDCLVPVAFVIQDGQ